MYFLGYALLNVFFFLIFPFFLPSQQAMHKMWKQLDKPWVDHGLQEHTSAGWIKVRIMRVYTCIYMHVYRD